MAEVKLDPPIRPGMPAGGPSVLVADPEPEVEEVVTSEGGNKHNEWGEFTRHQQFTDFWQGEQLGTYPAGWDIMTIQQKKGWMDVNVE